MLDSSEDIDQSHLVRAALDYIPQPLLKDVDLTKDLLINLDNKLRMYGTGEELKENLEIYQNFPLFYQKFGIRIEELNHIEPKKFESEFGNVFYNKQELLHQLHHTINEKYHRKPPPELLKLMKEQASRLEGCFQLVYFDPDSFAQYYKKLIDLESSESEHPITYQVQEKNDIQLLHRLARVYSEIFLPDRDWLINEFFSKKLQTRFFQHFIKTLAVRAFDDGPIGHFVMKSEFYNAISCSQERQIEYEDPDGFVETIDMEFIEKEFKRNLSCIEFIPTSILRAKHAAVPINTPNGGFCLLASDVLFETLRRLIFGFNVFQKVKMDKWNVVQEYMNLLISCFPSDINRPYFIEWSVIEKIRVKTDEFWKKYENIPVKSVRDVGDFGFTITNLKEEFEYLGLIKIFPEITNHAESVYREVDRSKNGNVLRTCDMFDALEKCQLACILNKFPKIQKLLQSQNCHKIAETGVSLLAADVFFETFRRLIFVIKIFQKVKRDNWNVVEEYMKYLISCFPADIHRPYFMEWSSIEKIRVKTDEYWKEYKNIPVKSVREVEGNGFTKKDLKKEIKYLGLTKIFPEIKSRAKMARKAVKDWRNRRVWGTSEMLDALENCQLGCVLDRFPVLQNFLRTQNALKNLKFYSPNSIRKIHQSVATSSKVSIKEKVEKKSKKVEKDETPEVSTSSESDDLNESRKEVIDAYKRISILEKRLKEKKGQRNKGMEKENQDLKKKYLKVLKENVKKTGMLKILKSEKSGKYRKIEELKKKLKENEDLLLDYWRWWNIDDERHKNEINEISMELEKEKSEKSTLTQKAIKRFVGIVQFEKNMSELDKEKNEEIEMMKNEYEKQKMELEGKIKEMDDFKEKSKELIQKTQEENNKKVENLEKKLKDIRKNHSGVVNKKNKEIENFKNDNKQLHEQTTELEKKLKHMEKSQKTAFKSNEEMKQLTARISEKEAEEARMKLENKSLIEKIRRLEEYSEKNHLEMTMKQSRLEAEFSEKDRVIRELQESNEEQISEKNQINKELQDKISLVRELFLSQFPLATSSESALRKIEEEPKRPSPLRCQLLGLQKIKDNLYLNSPLKLATEMKEKLISLSTQPEIHQMAIYEYQQYEGKLRNYQQEVEKKIQLLKKSESDDVTGLPSLPEFPSFSDRFIREYWLEIDKQKTSGELLDTECLFCFVEMKSDEKTLKCEHCRKITHLECSSKWLKIHRSCPHCRREQLDPNEFPILQ